jgi:DNA-binding response OmpR family regulator
MMQRNSSRLLNLVDQLLDLSKLESGRYQIRVASGDLGMLIRAIAESFQFTARQKQMTYDTTIAGLGKAWFDKDVVEKILTNLLSNAFKYTPEGGRVVLTAREAGGNLSLQVENAPINLAGRSIAHMFDRFYQGDAQAEGVGIGLSLVKELVELHHGSIRASQPEHQVIRLQIDLPVSKDRFAPEEIHASAVGAAAIGQVSQGTTVREATLAPETDPGEEQRDILLVVEDNDDVRQLIRSTFESRYRVIEARDGEQGIQVALECIPDLIISDIMMPGTDGLALCEHLKNDECTSHIPIILLTAKAGEEDQYQGLSTGADAYVTKPFKIKLLETRVQNLIDSRKALRARFSQEVILKPADIAVSNLDQVFLERVQQVIDAQVTEPDFSVQAFSEAVGMSRMQLHRKLKALTGLSASEFVRSQRLQLAASLLQSSDRPVSEIGYLVGFNDPSYFTKCFRETYGCSPTEYSQKNAS